MRDLIATKPGRYGTRRLQANDTFQARPRDARLLVAIGKAQYAPQCPAKQVDDIGKLRIAYENAFGKRPFMGWDADTLREKIAAGPAD